MQQSLNPLDSGQAGNEYTLKTMNIQSDAQRFWKSLNICSGNALSQACLLSTHAHSLGAHLHLWEVPKLGEVLRNRDPGLEIHSASYGAKWWDLSVEEDLHLLAFSGRTHRFDNVPAGDAQASPVPTVRCKSLWLAPPPHRISHHWQWAIRRDSGGI